MTSIIRAFALHIVVAIVAAFQSTTFSYATDVVAYAASNGSGTACTLAQPCGDLNYAIGAAASNAGTGGVGRVICLTPVPLTGTAFGSFGSDRTLVVDCAMGSAFATSFSILNQNGAATFRGVTFTQTFLSYTILVTTNGTLVLENCAIENSPNVALDLEPNGPLNLVIRNSRISNSVSGILLKPASGGSINATFDHVTVTGNAGGGIKVDTTNGPVTADITDSVISKNSANGINAVGNASGQGMVSIKNSVIAKNGIVGVQANGANAAVLVQTTLLDQNVAGATSVVNGGHISTYGNNSIVGSAGSGFTGSAPLQ